MFSTVIRHPMEKIQSSSVVFIQYLAAMAVVKGIKSYDKGYENIPVKMKWPNDVCKYTWTIQPANINGHQMHSTPTARKSSTIAKSAEFSSTHTSRPTNMLPSLELD